VKKQFADEPAELRKKSDYFATEMLSTSQEKDNHSSLVLHNEVSANRYEVFNLNVKDS